MNKSDKIITASVMSGMDISIKEKETSTSDNMTTVFLFGKPCIRVNRDRYTVSIDGRTVGSRKSSRLINSVLSSITNVKVANRGGKWYLLSCEDKHMQEFTDREVEVPLIKEALAEKTSQTFKNF